MGDPEADVGRIEVLVQIAREYVIFAATLGMVQHVYMLK